MTMQPEPGGPVLTEKVWNRLRHDGRLVRDQVTGDLPPMVRSLAWQQFQQMPMARWACSLIRLLEPQQGFPSLYRRRTRRPRGELACSTTSHRPRSAPRPRRSMRSCATATPSACPRAHGCFPSWPVEHAI